MKKKKTSRRETYWGRGARLSRSIVKPAVSKAAESSTVRGREGRGGGGGGAGESVGWNGGSRSPQNTRKDHVFTSVCSARARACARARVFVCVRMFLDALES